MIPAALNTIAIGGAVIGSTVIANGDPSLVFYGYLFFLASSLASIPIQLKHESQRGLLCLTFFFVGVNIFGLLRWGNII